MVINDLVEGVVTRIVNYGAFVEIEPGIEGLLHSSKMVRGSDTADPEKIVQVNEKHLLRVINIDSDKQRIALSLRAVTPKEQIAWMMAQSEDGGDEAAVESEESVDEVADTVVEEAIEAAPESEVAVEDASESEVEEASAEENTSEESSSDEADAEEETSSEVEAEAESAPAPVEEPAEPEESSAEESAEEAEEDASTKRKDN